MKTPKRCPKCDSKKIEIRYCAGLAIAKFRGDKFTVMVNGTLDGCRTIGEHFHITCLRCGYGL